MKQPLAIGKEVDGLYLVDHKSCASSLISSSSSFSKLGNNSAFSFSCQMSPLEIWHCRLGHMSFDNMKHINVISSCKSKPTSICHVCHQAKQHRSTFPLSTSCTSHTLEILHVDLRVPMQIQLTMDINTFSLLLMTSHVPLGLIFQLLNPMLFPFSSLSSLLFKHNFRPKFRSSDLIMVKNFLTPRPQLSMLLMASFTKHHVQLHLNRMELLRESINTYQKLLGPYSFNPKSPSDFGVNVF